MSEESHTEIDMLADLLAEKSILGLSVLQEAELREMQKEYGTVDEHTFDLAVAAFDLSFGQRHAIEMPTHLRQRILSQAALHVPALQTKSPLSKPDKAATSKSPEMQSRPVRSKSILSNPFTWRETAFVLVAAASIVIALFTWQNRTEISQPIVSAVDQRTALLNSEPQDLIRVQWKPSTETDPIGAQVNGDVIWSDAQQRGFMRFTGLPVNDPKQEQYQLWIFDADRDARYPVNGGVFDIESNTNVTVIPINAKIHVAQATLFAITIEKPGGVVVSNRQRLPVLAEVNR